jgi:transcription antitermination factor NusG
MLSTFFVFWGFTKQRFAAYTGKAVVFNWGMKLPKRSRHYWSLAATHRGQEERAASNIERQDFEYWLPRVAKLLENGKQQRSIMFPGWIFYKVRDGWKNLAATRGVRRLILCENTPSRVRETDLQYLRSLEREDGLVHLTPRLSLGVEVCVDSGPFAGVCGTVKSIVNCEDAVQRIRVLMSMMGKTVTKEFDERQLVLR